MRRIFLLAAFVQLLIAGSLHAEFKAIGTVKNVDPDKSILFVNANGRDRNVPIAADARILAENGTPLAGGLKASELKEGAVVTLTLEPVNGGAIIKTIQLGKHIAGAAGPGPGAKDTGGKPSVGFKPLTEMSADDKYKGEDGGLYGGGRNEPPAALLAAAKARKTARIVPLDADGKPAADGKIGLISISMSNATMEYARFKQIADADPRKSQHVAIVDCAQGGQAMAEWVDPKGRPWSVADQRLAEAKVSLQQVQVVWIKLANKSPSGDLAEHGKKLQSDTLAVVRNAKAHFPNLRIAYLGSRIYGGWSGGKLNPEPYAYEGAFVVRWLIQDQIKGADALKYDDTAGPAPAPLLLWGPYFWADGTTPRKGDNLVWERADLGPDGTHPSTSGRQKVADMLLKFFAEDPLAQTWFVKR